MQIYSVPLWNKNYEHYEDEKEIFLNAIKIYKEQNLTESHSNVFGYQSPKTLQNVEELKPLFNYICQIGINCCADLDFIECDVAITSAWLNINNSRQCMNNEHIGEHTFTGVFYLKAPKDSGKLVLHNSLVNKMWNGCKLSSKKNQFTGENIRIEPIEGSIFIFPSYLPQSVETNNHDDERISISFNLIALPKGMIYGNQINK